MRKHGAIKKLKIGMGYFECAKDTRTGDETNT